MDKCPFCFCMFFNVSISFSCSSLFSLSPRLPNGTFCMAPAQVRFLHLENVVPLRPNPTHIFWRATFPKLQALLSLSETDLEAFHHICFFTQVKIHPSLPPFYSPWCICSSVPESPLSPCRLECVGVRNKVSLVI